MATAATESLLRPDPRRLALRAAILATAALACALTLRATAGGWLSTARPDMAEALAPADARAQIASATALSKGRNGTLDPHMRALIAAALARDTTDPRGIELLALAADRAGQHAKAARLFHLSDAMGRRSLPTRLWLIQSSVDTGDVAGALRHFDIALRTAPESQPLLLPVLARAGGQPGLAAPVAAMLDRPSDWRLALFNVVGEGNLPELAPGLTQVALAMHDRGWLLANHVDDTLIAGLLADGEYRQAALVAARFRPGHSGAGQLLRDGHFADPAQRYPFGWQMEQGGGIEASRARIGDQPVLRYEARAGGSGPAATQLLQLAPGRYRLSVRVATAGADPIAQPFWTLTCAGTDGGNGVQIALLEQAPDASRANLVDFTVHDDCQAQWLSLHLRSSDNVDSQSGAISAVAVEPVGPRANNAPPRAG
jgi:hypothetical protein